MKKILLALVGVFALSAVSCDKNENLNGTTNEKLALLEVSTDGTTSILVNNICPIFGVTDPLNDDEIEFLYWLRENEKLSKDIYTVFATNYPNHKQFIKIASAEDTHIKTIERVLDYYEIEFPALNETGVFVNPEIQARYDELISGVTSNLEAFTIMAMLEEDNVSEYKTLELTIDNDNIKLIIRNFIRSSSNHLKAAVRQITMLGGNYTPIFLEQAIFDEIINSPFYKGNKYCCQGNKNCKTNREKRGRGNNGGNNRP